MKYHIRHVLGNTFYFAFPGLSIPFYRLGEHEIVLIDSGFNWTGPEILDYCRQNDLSVRAIIHTHVHPDHIGGDLTFGDFKDCALFASASELKDSIAEHIRASAIQKKNGQYDVLLTLKELRFIEHRIVDTDRLSDIDIDGKLFHILPSHGHSLMHQCIVTPDNVCCCGDLFMAGLSLDFARVPYSFDLASDLKEKQLLSQTDHPYFIAAHDGHFTNDDIGGILHKNLNVIQKILSAVSDVLSDNPGIEYDAAFPVILDILGVFISRDALWVSHTIKQYFDLNRNGINDINNIP